MKRFKALIKYLTSLLEAQLITKTSAILIQITAAFRRAYSWLTTELQSSDDDYLQWERNGLRYYLETGYPEPQAGLTPRTFSLGWWRWKCYDIVYKFFVYGFLGSVACYLLLALYIILRSFELGTKLYKLLNPKGHFADLQRRHRAFYKAVRESETKLAMELEKIRRYKIAKKIQVIKGKQPKHHPKPRGTTTEGQALIDTVDFNDRDEAFAVWRHCQRYDDYQTRVRHADEMLFEGGPCYDWIIAHISFRGIVATLGLMLFIHLLVRFWREYKVFNERYQAHQVEVKANQVSYCRCELDGNCENTVVSCLNRKNLKPHEVSQTWTKHPQCIRCVFDLEVKATHIHQKISQSD